MSIITIHGIHGTKKCRFEGAANLLQLLRDSGIYVAAPCGGKGICGKCKVFLKTAENVESVLACSTVVTGDCEAFISEEDADLSWNESCCALPSELGRNGFGAAVDLGTTTIALSIFNLADGTRLGSASAWNIQKSYGADVISRIGYCIENENGLQVLGTAVRSQVMNMLRDLCRTNSIPICEVNEIFLAGNTVMQHIFAGIPPDDIASAPFTPKTCFEDRVPYILGGIPVTLSPCVAGYVGGDITAGILSTGLHRKKGKSLFIDVGTNGEMAVGDAEGLTACAVASGPAFEGAGITCGMPASYGAVNRVGIDGDVLTYEVLGGGEAKGICGSGLLDLIACLLDIGYIDETGFLLEDEYGEQVFHLTDTVYVSQKDIRQLQLAKAAVAAGIKLLMKSERLGFDEIDALYLAGGFGNRLRPESAVRIGLLPSEMLGRIRALGNTSLGGAEMALLDPTLRDALMSIKNNCRYIELSSEADFNDCFVDEMNFPEV